MKNQNQEELVAVQRVLALTEKLDTTASINNENVQHYIYTTMT